MSTSTINISIRDSVEAERGCGYRKKGGLYLVGGRFGSPCGKMPIPLTVCPCCNQGIKQSRGFSWITAAVFLTKKCETNHYPAQCTTCPMHTLTPDTKVGLMWIGEKFYKTPADFVKEGSMQGISKRLAQIPKDLIVGETWVMLAHPKAIKKMMATVEFGEQTAEYDPGIFQAFIPERIEYVVKGDESPEELEKLVKRGLTLVNVIENKGDTAKLFEE
jgi:hypothetical protein